MIFSSTVFLAIFLPVVLFFYYVVFHSYKKAQNLFLFAASLVFYAYGEPWFVLVMLISILVNWWFGRMVDSYRKNKTACKRLLVCMVAFNLSILFIFKYLVFSVHTMNRFFHTNFTLPGIVLPIGISFFTFQAISYVIDVYRGHGRVQKNPVLVGLYIAFFPQLIAGPIVRYETVAEQMERRKESLSLFSKGCSRFITGLAKKMLLSNPMGTLADEIFGASLSQVSPGLAWLGAIAYAFQILFDFSGYSDMAIGLGKMFGFEFLENFNYPYLSSSITEFWRRWHISLGSWFRDYVYIPLGGSRGKSKARLIFNLFVVWACTGFWHGANWTFLSWGLLYFVLLVFEKLTGLAKTKRLRILRHFYTLFFVLIGWVLFRSDSLGVAFQYLKVMFGIGGGEGLWRGGAWFYLCEYAAAFLLCIAASLPLAKWKERLGSRWGVLFTRLEPVWNGLLLLLSVAYIAKGSYNPFIYFNF